jgi:hypothetical protein
MNDELIEQSNEMKKRKKKKRNSRELKFVLAIWHMEINTNVQQTEIDIAKVSSATNSEQSARFFCARRDTHSKSIGFTGASM